MAAVMLVALYPCPKDIEGFKKLFQNASAASEGGKQNLAHAVRISIGGPPILFVAEEDMFKFARTPKS